MEFNFDTDGSTGINSVVVNADLFDGSTVILQKALNTTESAKWQWTNTAKTNQILFISGWTKGDEWTQNGGSIITIDSISFDSGFSAAYTVG